MVVDDLLVRQAPSKKCTTRYASFHERLRLDISLYQFLTLPFSWIYLWPTYVYRLSFCHSRCAGTFAYITSILPLGGADDSDTGTFCRYHHDRFQCRLCSTLAVHYTPLNACKTAEEWVSSHSGLS